MGKPAAMSKRDAKRGPESAPPTRCPAVLHATALAALLLLGCAGRGTANGPDEPVAARPAETVVDHRRDATTPMPRRDTAYQVRHQRFVQRAAEGGVDLLFIGDSLVEGWNGAGRPVWDDEYAPLRAANFGIPADMTQFVLWRLADGELEGISPKAVVLMIGTNNLKSGPTRMPPHAAAAGAEAVVNLLREELPRARILLLGILPRQPEYDWMPQAVRETNALLARIADGGSVRFINFSDRYLRPDGAVNPDLYRGDLLHLSEAGYRLWADAIRDEVRDAFGP